MVNVNIERRTVDVPAPYEVIQGIEIKGWV